MMIVSNHILLRTFVLQAAGLPMLQEQEGGDFTGGPRESEGDPSTVTRPGGTFHFGNSYTDVPPVRTASGQHDHLNAISIYRDDFFTYTRTRSRGLPALLPVYLFATSGEGESGGRLRSG